jgi:acyl-CoA reductase-like NAD-dependent aldehyde dehydrogenase
MSEFTRTVGGDAVTTNRSYDVVNSASGDVYAEAPDCSHAELHAAMDAAAEAYGDWRGDEGVRRQLLAKIGDLLVASVDDLAPILTAEQGKSLTDAKREVLRSGAWFTYFAQLEIPRETVQDDAVAIAEVVRRPLGVVAASMPSLRMTFQAASANSWRRWSWSTIFGIRTPSSAAT